VVCLVDLDSLLTQTWSTRGTKYLATRDSLIELVEIPGNRHLNHGQPHNAAAPARSRIVTGWTDACLFWPDHRGEVEGSFVFEDDEVVGFPRPPPVYKGHTLVVPREHHVTLADLPAALLTTVFTAAQRLSAVMPEALGAQALRRDEQRGQPVGRPRPRCTSVPRTKGDGLRGFFWPRTKYADAPR
jgi:histidine triad (HIT) family protein